MKEEKPGQSAWTPVVRGVMGALLALTLAVSLWPGAKAAGPAEKMVIPLGQTVGIKLFSHGVVVVGLSDGAGMEGGQSPARECGLEAGDVITHINSAPVDTIEEVNLAVQAAAGAPLAIQADRGGKTVQFTAQAARCAGGGYKLGAWVRDSMAGIGTLTYYDPDTGGFAALGHGINDVDTGVLMPLESGGVMPASVCGVKRGSAGAPGELRGSFDLTQDLGALYANTQQGIFGKASQTAAFSAGQAVPVADRSQVRVGKAAVRTNVNGTEVKDYDAEILRVYPASAGDGRNLMIKITDPDLLAATGGIVQGMSGSPILQNGRLVGAVTHVMVNDAACGYGILAETMLAAGADG